MPHNGQHDDDRPPDQRLIEVIDRNPLDRHDRQMKQQVDGAGQLQPAQLPHQRSPDTLQGGGLGE